MALGAVTTFAAAAAAFGVLGGLNSDMTGGVRDRPLTYWLIALANCVNAAWAWPTLVSWVVDRKLPSWISAVHNPWRNPRSFETIRAGLPVLKVAKTLEPFRRPGFAGQTFGLGMLYVVISVPMQLLFGVAAMRPGPMELVEAVPLMASL